MAIDKVVCTNLQVEKKGKRGKKGPREYVAILKAKQTTARGTSRLGGSVNQKKCETIHIRPGSTGMQLLLRYYYLLGCLQLLIHKAKRHERVL